MTIDRALVVEDDDLGREFVTESLEAQGIETAHVANGREAVDYLTNEDVDFVISDLRMSELDGLGLLRWIKQHRPWVQVALMTAYGTMEVAVDAMRAGAEDILMKPFGPDQLTFVLERLRRRQQILAENRYLRTQTEQEESQEIVGRSPQIQKMLQAIRRVAPSKATVFIQGESGTGKELAARAIHRYSDRAGQSFIRVNCAALSETLLESELFGHERGAFTGAVQRHEGRFELAHRGTLLLDEVSEVSPRIQAKLLRVLEEEEFERVGGKKTLKVDVRIIATTNRNLEEAMQNGDFREDLYYRLHVVPLQLTPLRERSSDIPDLVEEFVNRYARINGRPTCQITPEAMRKIQEYSWPGNIRELSNFIQRTVVLCPGEVIEEDQISLPRTAASATSNVTNLLGRKIEDVERELILETLASTNGNRTHAAEVLGLTARTICNKIRLYRSQGFEVPQPQGATRRRPQEPVSATAQGVVS